MKTETTKQTRSDKYQYHFNEIPVAFQPNEDESSFGGFINANRGLYYDWDGQQTEGNLKRVLKTVSVAANRIIETMDATLTNKQSAVVKKMRENPDATQDELAAHFNVNQSTIVKVLQGRLLYDKHEKTCKYYGGVRHKIAINLQKDECFRRLALLLHNDVPGNFISKIVRKFFSSHDLYITWLNTELNPITALPKRLNSSIVKSIISILSNRKYNITSLPLELDIKKVHFKKLSKYNQSDINIVYKYYNHYIGLRLDEPNLFTNAAIDNEIKRLETLKREYLKPVRQLNMSLRFIGIPRTEETKKKISRIRKKMFQDGLIKMPSNKGRIASKETRQKLSIAHKGQKSPMKGKHHTEKAKKQMSISAKKRHKKRKIKNKSKNNV